MRETLEWFGMHFCKSLKVFFNGLDTGITEFERIKAYTHSMLLCSCDPKQVDVGCGLEGVWNKKEAGSMRGMRDTLPPDIVSTFLATLQRQSQPCVDRNLLYQMHVHRNYKYVVARLFLVKPAYRCFTHLFSATKTIKRLKQHVKKALKMPNLD